MYLGGVTMKNNNRAYQALKRVAERRGVPVESVIQSVDELIQQTFSDIHAQNNQQAMEVWSKIPRNGSCPTAIELVDYLTKRCEAELRGEKIF